MGTEVRAEWERAGAAIKESGNGFKALVLFLPLIGIFGLVIGWRFDLSGYWISAPFQLNIYSAGTTACFGIPLALVVLRSVTSYQEERTALLSAIRTAIAAAGELNERAGRLVAPGTDINRLQHNLAYAHGAIQGLIRDVEKPANPRPGALRFTEKLSDAAASVENAFNTFNGARISDVTRATTELRQSRDLLVIIARPKLLTVGLRWMTPEMDYEWGSLYWDPYEMVTLDLKASAFVGVVEAHLNGSLPLDRLKVHLDMFERELESRVNCVHSIEQLRTVSSNLAQEFRDCLQEKFPHLVAKDQRRDR
ncbi:hypothetical protein ACRB8A_19745 (plasmid) [Arthrobacter sp. G.S.26]|uniref:hypothetical protein n=1 Tax=Arthrobacter sp. G.S.26 TaxID=3433706 RepID=UPI003D774C26